MWAGGGGSYGTTRAPCTAQRKVRGITGQQRGRGPPPLCTRQACQEAALLDGWTTHFWATLLSASPRTRVSQGGAGESPLPVHRSCQVSHRSERPLAPTRCPAQRHTQRAPSSHLGPPGRWAVLFLQSRRGPPFPSLEVISTPGWFIHHFPPFNTSHALVESSLTTVMSPSCGGSTPAGVDVQVGGPGGAVAVAVPHPGAQLAAGVAAGLSAVGRRGSPALVAQANIRGRRAVPSEEALPSGAAAAAVVVVARGHCCSQAPPWRPDARCPARCPSRRPGAQTPGAAAGSDARAGATTRRPLRRHLGPRREEEGEAEGGHLRRGPRGGRP